MTPMLQLTPEIAKRIYKRYMVPVTGGPGRICRPMIYPKGTFKTIPRSWKIDESPPTEITESEHQSLLAEIGSQLEPGWTCPHCGQKNADWATNCGRCEWEMKIRKRHEA